MEEKSNLGRPTKFTEEISNIILGMAKYGLTDAQMAGVVGVTEQTLNNWKIAHPEFFESLKHEKQKADMIVADTLYKKATGGIKVTEIHDGVDASGNVINKTVVKEVPPSDTSMIFWLKNRQPDKWRDKVETELSTGDSGLTLAYNLKDDKSK